MRVFAVISKEALTKRRIAVNLYLFQYQGRMNKIDSEYLENYVWIYAHANHLNQGVIL